MTAPEALVQAIEAEMTKYPNDFDILRAIREAGFRIVEDRPAAWLFVGDGIHSVRLNPYPPSEPGVAWKMTPLYTEAKE